VGTGQAYAQALRQGADRIRGRFLPPCGTRLERIEQRDEDPLRAPVERGIRERARRGIEDVRSVAMDGGCLGAPLLFQHDREQPMRADLVGLDVQHLAQRPLRGPEAVLRPKHARILEPGPHEVIPAGPVARGLMAEVVGARPLGAGEPGFPARVLAQTFRAQDGALTGSQDAERGQQRSPRRRGNTGATHEPQKTPHSAAVSSAGCRGPQERRSRMGRANSRSFRSGWSIV
jgi:hypothetical protein